MTIHGAWAEEYGSLELPSSGNPQSSTVKALTSKLKPALRQASALDQLEAEMKLLQWHKLANDQALKAALIKTKKLRSKDREDLSDRKTFGNDMELDEKVAWMQQIIEEEQSKPLQVSKDFVLQYELKEHEQKEKLNNEVLRHLHNLKRIRKKIDAQVVLRQRQQDFRKWKAERAPVKKAIMEGKMVAPESIAQTSQVSHHQTSRSPQQTGIATVLQSLTKLEELEQRIATLERNKVAKQVAIDGGRSGTVKASVKFAKSREASLASNPARSVYTVRLHQGMTNKVGNAVRRQPVRQPVPKAGAHISAEKYLRSLPNLNAQGHQDSRRQAMRAHERQMNMTLTTGQKALRNRVKTKVQRQQQTVQSERRHRVAVKALDATRIKPHMVRSKVNIQPAKGAAAGRRYANKAMQDFEDIRRMHQRRREALNRQSTRSVSSTRRSATQSNRREPLMSRTAPRATIRGNTSLDRSAANSKNNNSRESYPVVAGLGGVRALRRR